MGQALSSAAVPQRATDLFISQQQQHVVTPSHTLDHQAVAFL